MLVNFFDGTTRVVLILFEIKVKFETVVHMDILYSVSAKQTHEIWVCPLGQ